MEKEQELEWLEAQKIVISEDLVGAAKKQLEFLAAIDRHRCLYSGPVLQRAIYRYKTYWLPLLAKHTESEVLEAALVIPLDCEWIWHCHRLNPLRYKADCEEFYGRILDNKNVVSTVQGGSKRQTQEIWTKLYPEESYEIDLSSPFSENILETSWGAAGGTKYDLVAAVERQVPFYYQVSKPVMNVGLFLEEAVARYKGFLHMIKRNKERSIRRFCVPTYDIDLIWHSHQLHPASYCMDLVEALGKVLEHDDTDSDRSKGQKLDTGFSGTTMQWEETFGTRYWRAGGMYRGVAPSPLTVIPQLSNKDRKTVVSFTESHKALQLSRTTVVEVLLEIVGVRNLPEAHKGKPFVYLSKKKADVFFDERIRLGILSESKEKQVASFQCEPTGELFFELMSHSPSSLRISRPAKAMGTTSISLQNMLDPVSKLSVEKWLELVPISGTQNSKPIGLRIAVSVTTPVPAPHVLHMVRSHPILKNSCFFPLNGGTQRAKGWTCVNDEFGNAIINVQIRDSKKSVAGNRGEPKREVIGIIGWSGETRVLAELSDKGWSLIDGNSSSQLRKKPIEDGSIFELRCNPVVQLFPGRKLVYEPKNCPRQKNERDFITAVEFSKENPYGNAVALLNLKSGAVKVEAESFVIYGITLAFIIPTILRKEGSITFDASGEKSEESGLIEDAHGYDEGRISKNSLLEGVAKKGSAVVSAGVNGQCEDVVKNEEFGACGGGCGGGCGSMMKSGGQGGGLGSKVKSGGCGTNCGSGCGNMVKSGGCGSGCGSGCGNIVKSGGCGSGCGSGCGNMVKSGGCGSGCGGGCGNLVQSGGCGSGCGGGCGNMIQSGGCGSGCGGSCGNMLKSDGCGGGFGSTEESGGGCGGGGCGGGCGNSGHILVQ